MKEYQLNTATSHDNAPAFVCRMSQWAKATNEITGLVRGLIADGELNKLELDYLKAWIEKRPELMTDPLVSALAVRISRIYRDGIITPEELKEVRSLLKDFGADNSKPAKLPLDDPMPDIAIPTKSFCFTGTFVSGTRSWCEDQITTRGGSILEIRAGLDYLVIGSKISAGWANQTYGRKIERALSMKAQSPRLAIVNEDHWLAFINVLSSPSTRLKPG